MRSIFDFSGYFGFSTVTIVIALVFCERFLATARKSAQLRDYAFFLLISMLFGESLFDYLFVFTGLGENLYSGEFLKNRFVMLSISFLIIGGKKPIKNIALLHDEYKRSISKEVDKKGDKITRKEYEYYYGGLSIYILLCIFLNWPPKIF